MRVKPWERIEPLLPKKQRRFRSPGRKPLDDRKVVQGILFVLHTGLGGRADHAARRSSAAHAG
jgi:transposase